MPVIGDGITIDTDVKTRNLIAIEDPRKRPIVANNEKVKQGLQRFVQIVMRTGHVIRGRQVAFIVKPENTCTLSKTQNLTALARFPNLATLQRVNLTLGFTIINRYNILVEINRKAILIYRHGMLEYWIRPEEVIKK